MSQDSSQKKWRKNDPRFQQRDKREMQGKTFRTTNECYRCGKPGYFKECPELKKEKVISFLIFNED
jgi:hypothetical protein